MSWVLYVLGILTFAGSYKLMPTTKQLGFSFLDGMIVLFICAAVAVTILSVGPALKVLRNTARNRRND